MATGSVTTDAERRTSRWRRLAGYTSLGFMLGAVFVALAWFYFLQDEHDIAPNLVQIRFFDKVRRNGGEIFYNHDAHWRSKVLSRFYQKTGWRLPGTSSSPHLHGSEHVARLRLVGPAITDEELRFVQNFTRLKVLYLTETGITDAGLKHLSGLNQLRTLVLEGPFTDTGLENLSGLEQLEHLSLSRTKLTDAGLVHLTGLKNLRWLNLRNTNVTSNGVGTLKQAMPKVRIDR